MHANRALSVRNLACYQAKEETLTRRLSTPQASLSHLTATHPINIDFRFGGGGDDDDDDSGHEDKRRAQSFSTLAYTRRNVQNRPTFNLRARAI